MGVTLIRSSFAHEKCSFFFSIIYYQACISKALLYYQYYYCVFFFLSTGVVFFCAFYFSFFFFLICLQAFRGNDLTALYSSVFFFLSFPFSRVVKLKCFSPVSAFQGHFSSLFSPILIALFPCILFYFFFLVGKDGSIHVLFLFVVACSTVDFLLIIVVLS